MVRIRHYFASANTGEGFYNCFGSINDARRPGFLYILKGGPGTGKSTLMKKIGAHFERLGEPIEYFRCSSDDASLDGVRLPRANVAVIDGTAPHVTEAEMPGVTAQIVNLGEFIGTGIRGYRQEIERLLQLKKQHFESAYAYIRAAAALEAAELTAGVRTMNTNAAKKTAREIFENLQPEKKENKTRDGIERRLFLSAVSSRPGAILPFHPAPAVAPLKRGIPAVRATKVAEDQPIEEEVSVIARSEATKQSPRISDRDCRVGLCPPRNDKVSLRPLNGYENVIYLNGDLASARAVLDNLAVLLIRKRRDFTGFCDVLSPHAREAIEIGDALITAEHAEVSEQQTINHIFELTANALSQARAAHQQIEARYIPSMDFDRLNRTAEQLIHDLAVYC
ncbi:MAG: hypothetical protein FWE62_02175 [Firmicutes bacterium]|nr:hypothetical protein [Bacillota bacterium]